MATHRGRWALLLLASLTLAVSLVACQAPSGAGPTSPGGGGLVLSTPGDNSASPTPAFPPFTIGAWPSDRTPGVNGTITIYVLCRVQDQAMTGPSQPPPAPVSVQVIVMEPIPSSGQGTCGPPDGIAAVPVTFNDPRPGFPVRVQVTAVWKGVTYTNETFFTPGASGAKPTATPKGNGKGPPTPTATP